MIIKMTLNDNDFSEVIESFIQRLYYGYPVRESGNGDFFAMIKERKHFMELYNNDDFTEEEKEWFIEVITKAWNQHINNRTDKEYLQKNFVCKIVESITGKWENGEAFYFFPGAYGNKHINF